jgi:hypothetical protein
MNHLLAEPLHADVVTMMTTLAGMMTTMVVTIIIMAETRAVPVVAIIMVARTSHPIRKVLIELQ